MKISIANDSIEYKQNAQTHPIQFSPFSLQFVTFFKVGYHIGIVPFKLQVETIPGNITIHSTVLSKVNI